MSQNLLVSFFASIFLLNGVSSAHAMEASDLDLLLLGGENLSQSEGAWLLSGSNAPTAIGVTVLLSIGMVYYGKKQNEIKGIFEKAASEIKIGRANGKSDSEIIEHSSDDLKMAFEIERASVAKGTHGKISVSNDQMLDAILKDDINLKLGRPYKGQGLNN